MSPTKNIKDHRLFVETPENPHVNMDLDPSVQAEPGSADPVSPTGLWPNDSRGNLLFEVLTCWLPDVQRRQFPPAPVQSSERKAGSGLTESADPKVVEEKFTVQDELQKKVAEK